MSTNIDIRVTLLIWDTLATRAYDISRDAPEFGEIENLLKLLTWLVETFQVAIVQVPIGVSMLNALISSMNGSATEVICVMSTSAHPRLSRMQQILGLSYVDFAYFGHVLCLVYGRRVSSIITATPRPFLVTDRLQTTTGLSMSCRWQSSKFVILMAPVAIILKYYVQRAIEKVTAGEIIALFC